MSEITTNEQLAQLIRDGRKDLIPQLWEQTERFIWMMAGKRLGNSPYRQQLREDLYQQGFLALLDAIEKYEEVEGASFIHYLAFHLMNHFNEALNCKTARQKKEPLNNALSLDKELEQESGDSYTLADILCDPEAEEPFQEVLEDDRRRHVKEFVSRAIETLEANQSHYCRALMDNNMVRSDTYRAIGIEKRSHGESLHAKSFRELRKYIIKHKKEVEEMEIFDGRAYRSTGYKSWKHNLFTSSTERLALDRVERWEKIIQQRELREQNREERDRHDQEYLEKLRAEIAEIENRLIK